MFVDIAKSYVKAGYSVIPVSISKMPTIRAWTQYQEKPMTEEECEKHFKDAFGIALICGGTHGTTCIDVDLKYDLSGDIFERYKQKVPPKILKKMYVQETQSGGYHMIFNCPDIIEGNQKLASRFTTADEKHQTYIEHFENPVTKDKALKIASNDVSRVIFETRGTGGYCLIAPTKGYKKIYGKISTITLEEYHILLETAREFDELRKIIKRDSSLNAYSDKWKLSPFEDYNERGDVLRLLEANGWTTVGRTSGRNIRFKRPGKSSTSSALFDTTTKIFNCFSTSTSLDNTKGYNPSGLFIHYECNDDTGFAYKKLIEEGFGLKK